MRLIRSNFRRDSYNYKGRQHLGYAYLNNYFIYVIHLSGRDDESDVKCLHEDIRLWTPLVKGPLELKYQLESFRYLYDAFNVYECTDVEYVSHTPT